MEAVWGGGAAAAPRESHLLVLGVLLRLPCHLSELKPGRAHQKEKKKGKHPYPARLGYFLSTICCNSVQRLHFPGTVPYPTPFVLLIAVNPIQNTVRLGPPNQRLCRGFWSLHLLLVYMYAGIYVKPLFKVIQGLALSLQRPMSGQ